MSLLKARTAYRRTQVNTANPAELAAQLCLGALKFADQAQRALDAADLEGCHNNLVKAQACVNELQTSLDRARGGELAVQLAALYGFAGRRLVEANVRKDRQSIREARAVLSHLQETWSMVAQPRTAPLVEVP